MSVNYDFPCSNYLYEVRESQMIVNSMYFHDWTDENRFKYKKKTHEKCDTSHLCEEIWRGDDLVVHFVQFIQFFCEFVPIVHYSVTTYCSNKKQNLLQIQNRTHLLQTIPTFFNLIINLHIRLYRINSTLLNYTRVCFFWQWNIILAAIIKRHDTILIVIWICYTHSIWLE